MVERVAPGRSGGARLLVVLPLLLPAAIRAQSAPVAAPALNPGDAVVIQVWEQPLLSGEFVVDAEGRLLHPLYKTVTVTGVPVSVAETRLVSVIQQHHRTDPRYSFQPLLRVAVEGEVRQPSITRLPPGTTVAEAIALAGGPTERGNPERVRLVRGDSSVELDLRDPAHGDQRMPIRSGDRIVVQRRSNVRTYFMSTISVLGTIASIANLIRRSR